MSDKPNVLFLCTGNSCRSQMAEGFLRHWGHGLFTAHSAGTNPASQIHPLAVEVMQEKGIDISAQHPKAVSNFLGRLPLRHLIIVCDGANEACPRTFPGIVERHFWPFDDPAQFVGSHEETTEKFRAVRDQIETHIKSWLSQSLSGSAQT